MEESVFVVHMVISVVLNQEHKIYVQDVLAQQSRLVWTLISQQRAYFYVAGCVPTIHSLDSAPD